MTWSRRHRRADRIQLAVSGSSVTVRGDEIVGLLGDVPGVENVIDEIRVQGIQDATEG